MRALVFAVCLFCAVLAGVGVYRCDNRPEPRASRREVLEQTIQQVVRPRFEQLAIAADLLSSRLGELAVNPSPERLHECQQNWVALHGAWKAAQCFDGGPVQDGTFFAEISYWPAYAMTIENVVRSTRPLDAAFFEVLGAGAKGIYAIEYLLFDLPGGNAGKVGSVAAPAKPRLSATLILTEPTGPRRRAYARGLAEHLAAKCDVLRAAAKRPSLPAEFAERGQDTIHQIVNQLVESLETSLVARVSKHLEQLDLQRLTFESIEGVASGTSLQALAVPLRAAEELYLGHQAPGLNDLTRHLNPELDGHLRAQFQSAIAAVNAIQLPLDQALLHDRPQVEKALSECRALEVLCKADLASILGVTITFGSTDGD